jgi:hypothetical protein
MILVDIGIVYMKQSNDFVIFQYVSRFNFTKPPFIDMIHTCQTILRTLVSMRAKTDCKAFVYNLKL